MKVILIDDENVILQGLKKLIDWRALDAEIVGEAGDGAQGLALIEALHPDLVISDIAMPNLSGIELLQKLKERRINVKMIFLSGYQDFGYAQEAMRYGVGDYLLKPVSASELSSVVENVRQQLQREHSFRVLKKMDSRPEMLFRSILQGGGGETLTDFLTRLKLPRDVPGAVCVSMRLAVKASPGGGENQSLTRFEIYEFIQRYLEREHLGVFLKKEFDLCSFLLFTANDRAGVQAVCDTLTAHIYQRYKVKAIVGAGAWKDPSSPVLYLYKTSKFAVELYYFDQKPYIDYDAVKKDYTHSLDEYEAKVKELKQQICFNLDPDTVLAEILVCVQLMGDIHYGNKSATVNGCILLSGELFFTLQEVGLVDKSDRLADTAFLEELRKKSTFRQLLTQFEDYYRRLFLKIKVLCCRAEPAEIVRIKQYIGGHFKENISLEGIAERVGLSASYISTFFKKETGKNFKTYLTEVRMKEAFRLLNSTNLKSYELAEAVGYQDVKQFREKFREIYGISPQQYKKHGSA